MASSAATLEVGLPLDSTMGAMLIGVIVSGVLHGVCLVQAFLYFTSYANDHWLIKAMVITTCTFDAIHLSFVSHAIYHYLVSYFRDEEMLQKLIWSVLMEALFTGVNAGIVQLFYTYRVWKLSKRNHYLAGLIVALIFATTGCGVAWVILSMQLSTYRELLTINPLTITINALATTVDVLIACSLCYLLHRSRTGFRRSDTVITKLIIFVVNTGVLTSMCAISSLICLVASPNTLIYASFYFCIGRFYTNSFLATLNARRNISGSTQASERDTSHMVMSIPASVLNSHGSTLNRKTQDISIHIETTKEAVLDANGNRPATSRISPREMPQTRKEGDNLSVIDDDESAATRKGDAL